MSEAATRVTSVATHVPASNDAPLVTSPVHRTLPFITGARQRRAHGGKRGWLPHVQPGALREVAVWKAVRHAPLAAVPTSTTPPTSRSGQHALRGIVEDERNHFTRFTAQLEAQVEGLSTELEATQAQVEERNHAIKELQAEVAGLNAELKATRAQVAGLSAELVATQAQAREEGGCWAGALA